MKDLIRVAIIGATGAVGRRMMAELEHYGIPAAVSLYASSRSAGEMLKFRGEELRVKAFDINSFKGYDFALMSAGGAFSKQYAKDIVASGCAVIDNSSAWRMDDQVPLVVPEVNSHVLKTFKKGIIANPNCSTIQLVVSLKPLAQKFGLDSVNVATYQSVSGSGQKGMEELKRQQEAAVNADPVVAVQYAKPIHNNLIPAIDVMREGGHCFEEEKMVRETRRIMEIPDLPMYATTVRVPVMNCHSEAVTVSLSREVSRQDVMAVLANAEGINFRAEDDYEAFPYPNTIVGRRDVWVGRVRLPLDQKLARVVQYWNVADNLNKGAATNAVQILKLLL